MKFVVLFLIAFNATAEEPRRFTPKKIEPRRVERPKVVLKNACAEDLLSDFSQRNEKATLIGLFEVEWVGGHKTFSQVYSTEEEIGRPVEDKHIQEFLKSLSPRADQVTRANLYIYAPRTGGQVIQKLEIKTRN